MEYFTLNNGIQMPKVGYGVLAITDAAECERCVLDALEVGYRLIDTAQGYGNERAVGSAIRKSSIPREDIFLTTKLWIAGFGYEQAKEAIQGSLDRLGLDYIDLLLIHHPFNDVYGTWRAMSEFYKAGKIRAIGISNFYADRLVDFVHFNDIVPAVNQLEMHVFHQRPKELEVMNKHNIQAQAWSPIDRGSERLLSNPILKAIAEKYGKTIPQVALRYLVQKGVSVVPKTVNKKRMVENISIFDFVLSDEEMNIILTLDTGKTTFFSHEDPKDVERLINMIREY